MKPRIVKPHDFHAYGVLIPWQHIFIYRRNNLNEYAGQPNFEAVKQFYQEAKQRIAQTNCELQVQIRWLCNTAQSIPFEPFTVWKRPTLKDLFYTKTHLASWADFINNPSTPAFIYRAHNELYFNKTLSHLRCTCKVIDSQKPIAIVGYLAGKRPEQVVGIDTFPATHIQDSEITLNLRSAGMDIIELHNVSLIEYSVEVIYLVDTVNSDQWEPIEKVGLPTTMPLANYKDTQQGLQGALTDSISAAKQRLERGSPPFGWWPLTQQGYIAPQWLRVAPATILTDIQDNLLAQPAIYSLFANNALESQVVDTTPINNLTTTFEFEGLGLLNLTILSDPHKALATGFGTAYNLDQNLVHFNNHTQELSFNLEKATDYMVTAEFPEKDEILAAYIPHPSLHYDLSAPQNLKATQAGWIAPNAPNESWAETVHLHWNKHPDTIAMEKAITGITAYCLPDQQQAYLIQAEPYLLTDAPTNVSNLKVKQHLLVDPNRSIAIGSGGNSLNYMVAVQDTFGIWSKWSDTSYQGSEPIPEPPAILTLKLDSHYIGSNLCPTLLRLDFNINWAYRTPSTIELALSFYPQATIKASTYPKAFNEVLGDGFLKTYWLTFNGDQLIAPIGGRVTHLDSTGEKAVNPGLEQMQIANTNELETTRRYRLELDIAPLDFQHTPYWGARAWIRSTLSVELNPTQWSPPINKPALTQVASPIPTQTIFQETPTLQLGSTLDAQGQSHVSIQWTFAPNNDQVIIWEAVESRLLEQAPNFSLPMTERLQHLHNRYNHYQQYPAQQKAHFKRIKELAITTNNTSVDIALTKGSKEIHLFAVTFRSITGVESSWPSRAEFLQCYIAPKIVEASVPILRILVQDSNVQISLSCKSAIPIQTFKLYRTLSPVLAGKLPLMGPPFININASSAGNHEYTAQWEGEFPPNWQTWYVSAQAIPVQNNESGILGMASQSSNTIPILALPNVDPYVENLTYEFVRTDHFTTVEVIITANTTALDKRISYGSHSITIVTNHPQISTLNSEPISLDTTVLYEANRIELGLGRLQRRNGITPIIYKFEMEKYQSESIDFTITISDPLGRSTTKTITIPPYVDPYPIIDP